MNLPADRAHIAMFDIEECRTFTARLERHFAQQKVQKQPALQRPRVMNQQQAEASDFLDSMLSMKLKAAIAKRTV